MVIGSLNVIDDRQAYAFMNGVLNTDNTSIFGLSLDFGPFAVFPDHSLLTLVYGCMRSYVTH